MQTPSPTERFIICAGSKITPWCCAEDIFEMDRSATISWIAAGNNEHVSRVVMVDLANGKSADVTPEIFDSVCDRFADDGEPLSEWAYSFVEAHRGLVAARYFRRAA